jgi:hypothetical protein
MLSLFAIEWKRCGANVALITLATLSAFTVICVTGGDLIDFSLLGFEVICPFLIALLVCEWVQTLSDPMIDVIVVHSKSLFWWVAGRFFVVAGISGALCIVCMAGLWLWALKFPLIETLFVFAATTFFFTSIGVFVSFLSKQSHAPAAICGTIWLLAIMARSLTMFPVIAFFYPLLKFADSDTEIWFANKMTLLVVAICLWSWIYLTCKKVLQTKVKP